LQWLLERGDKTANDLMSLGSQIEETSPSRFIRPGMPPVLYIRGGKDELIPRTHVDVLVSLADKFNFPVEVFEIDDMGHAPGEEDIAKISQIIKEFIYRYFKKLSE